ncbi:replication factor C subunit 3 [Acyrthosiphon pisum]|uniref:Replication factor C subunit 3 n=1 Tax=Acyrthosiphon pisum TaxID=7029 RepID=A0A8R1W306_ACYPI|nr:replication factor C subunit 3 [Acyrthosiphon pisum]|eukprot:XP_001951302.1 PREDICTED: replication factor C subunit 3 [Acyrthosiphon pisum]
MSLWADKYRPNSLQKVDYHQDQAQHLTNLVNQGDFPHLLFYGPNGAGKKTRILALLRQLYGPGVERLRTEHMNFMTPSNKKFEIMTVASNYHIEVNASDAGMYDRIVVMELIKTVAQTHQLDSTKQRHFKVILLTEVDRLTKEAQQALRRTMEKYMATCRIILCANSIGQVIPAIRSRCLAVRVPAPTHEDICKILKTICKKEGLTLPDELALIISQNCERNLRRAILMLEASKVKQYPFDVKQSVVVPDWQLYIGDTAKQILSQQTPGKLLEVRSMLYELIVHGIPTNVIFKFLLKELVKNCDISLKHDIVEIASFYEHSLLKGNKTMFHLEAFVAKFMLLYSKFMEESLHGIF